MQRAHNTQQDTHTRYHIQLNLDIRKFTSLYWKFVQRRILFSSCKHSFTTAQTFICTLFVRTGLAWCSVARQTRAPSCTRKLSVCQLQISTHTTWVHMANKRPTVKPRISDEGRHKRVPENADKKKKAIKRVSCMQALRYCAVGGPSHSR